MSNPSLLALSIVHSLHRSPNNIRSTIIQPQESKSLVSVFSLTMLLSPPGKTLDLQPLLMINATINNSFSSSLSFQVQVCMRPPFAWILINSFTTQGTNCSLGSRSFSNCLLLTDHASPVPQMQSLDSPPPSSLTLSRQQGDFKLTTAFIVLSVRSWRPEPLLRCP